jgi:hypothetical protein
MEEKQAKGADGKRLNHRMQAGFFLQGLHQPI